MSNTKRPIAEGLFTWPSESPHLLASKCGDCGAVEFPTSNSCPACGEMNMEDFQLPNRGTLWTWTIQRHMPKAPYNRNETPETFQPYGVGYLELPGIARIEGALTVNDPDKLKIGMEMEIVFEKWNCDEDGTEVLTYMFKPVEETA